MKIVVLGATGLLGGEVFSELHAQKCRNLLGTSSHQLQGFLKFNILSDHISEFLTEQAPTHVINCTGLIPQKMSKIDPVDYAHKMLKINAKFPRELSFFAKRSNIQLIQIRTDCVYNGKSGRYTENSCKLPNSIYGASKLIGETTGINQHHIRTSIVGYQPTESVSLLGWFRNLPEGAIVNGYTNHHWNGVTTSIFARVSAGLIHTSRSKSTESHLVPSGSLSKYEMLLIFRTLLNREDIQINPLQAKSSVDRRLCTIDVDTNRHLWELAGYSSIPNIRTMLEKELSEQINRYK